MHLTVIESSGRSSLGPDLDRAPGLYGTSADDDGAPFIVVDIDSTLAALDRPIYEDDLRDAWERQMGTRCPV